MKHFEKNRHLFTPYTLDLELEDRETYLVIYKYGQRDYCEMATFHDDKFGRNFVFNMSFAGNLPEVTDVLVLDALTKK